MSEPEEILIISTHGPDNAEYAMLPFIVAGGAIAMDVKPTVFLLGDAVRLAVKGVVEKLPKLENLPDPVKVFNDFLAAGGKILICNPCRNHRNITEDDLVEGAEIGGAAGLVTMASSMPSITV